MKARTWVILGVFFGLLVQFASYGHLVSPSAVVAIHIVDGLAIFVGAFVVLRRLDQRWLTTPPARFPAEEQVDTLQVDTLLEAAGAVRVVSYAQAKFFALCVQAPAQVRKRIVEEYKLEERMLRQKVVIDAEVPLRHRGQSKVFYFPAIIPAKGKLLDDWNVWDGRGNELPALTYREYLIMLSGILRILLAACCTGQPDQDPRTKMTPKALIAEHAALEIVIKRNIGGRSITEADARGVSNRIRALPVAEDSKKHAHIAMLEMVAQVVRKLCMNYVIAVPVTPDETGRFVLSYNQSLIPNLELAQTPRGLHRWARMFIGSGTVAFGAQPVDLTLSIENASTCQSYHLQVDGPDGLYLAEQEAIDFDNTLTTVARGAPTHPRPRFRKRLGQSLAHFYVRYFPEEYPGEIPRIRFQYLEVPPGSLFRAAIAAGASFALIWAIGAFTSLGDAGTDAPVLLLAFPAAAAAWLGYERPSRRLIEATLPGRLCLVVTIVLSLLSAVLFMAHREAAVAKPPFHWWQVPAGFSLLWVHDLLWSLLIVAALVNMIIAAYKCLLSTWRYCYLASRAEANNNLTRRG